MGRATGACRPEAYWGRRRSPGLHPWDVEPARDGSKPILSELLRLGERVVDRGEHQILEDLDVVRVDGGRVDGDGLDRLLARGYDLDHATADGGLDRLRFELLLSLGELGLELLSLFEEIPIQSMTPERASSGRAPIPVRAVVPGQEGVPGRARRWGRPRPWELLQPRVARLLPRSAQLRRGRWQVAG